MDIPQELQPTDKIEIQLSGKKIVFLPVSRLRFSTWKGDPVNFNYGSKPIINYRDEACFAELAILRILLEHGWDGVWVETYGGIHYLRSMPQTWSLKSKHTSIPHDKEDFLQKIWKTAKTTACFDVFAWHGDRIVFFEAKKSGKDKLTSAQIRFIEGALACGVSLDSLILVEWEDIDLSVRKTEIMPRIAHKQRP